VADVDQPASNRCGNDPHVYAVGGGHKEKRMMRTRKGAIAVALGAVVSLAACGGGSSGGGGAASSGGAAAPSSGTAPAPSSGGAAAATGTLTVLTLGPQEHWDPQRTYIGADIEFALRAFYRTLTQYTVGDKPEIVPDLATDLGTASDGGKTWKFTLKDGVKWEDGTDITCADLKYGASRTFAQDVITGGPNYIITYLDVPSDTDGSSKYKGPYTKVGQDLFDKAITCDGKTITYHFKQAWNDFPTANAALPMLAPFKQAKDQGDKSDYAIFSSGPYKLDGTFDKDKGGKLVLNTNWDPATDTVRKAPVATIQYNEGIATETAYQRLIADAGDDKTAVAQINAPPSVLPQIEGNPGAKTRSLTVPAPYVDYIAPNYKSKVFSNEKARQAFAMATNRDAYVTAYGGKQVMDPSYALCNKALPCYKEFNPFGAPTTGDPAGAKTVLQSSGLTLPVKIKVVYRSRPTSDKALAALKQGWDAAGFEVTLEPLTTKYYATIQSPAYADRDAFWAGWGADWPSGSTVLPALMDGRVNISKGGSGQDYGYFNDADVNKAIDAAYAIADATAREKAWGDIDETIAKKGGVIPLVDQKFTFMHGSGIKTYQTNALLGGYFDLTSITLG
jgi:peptide/nickel transport system substrate-binding protein